MRIRLTVTMLAILLLGVVVPGADAQFYDWTWRQQLPLWPNVHGCRLTDNNGAKAVDIEPLYGEQGNPVRVVVAAVQDAENSEMNVVFYQWDKEEERWYFDCTSQPRPGDGGVNGAVAFTAYPTSYERDQVHCIWYDDAGEDDDTLEYADTLYDDRAVDNWATHYNRDYDYINEDIAIDAWERHFTGDLDTLVYLAFCGDPPDDELGVYVLRSTSSGASWEVRSRVATGAATNISIAAEPDQKWVYVAFQRIVSEVSKVYIYRSTDFGVSWEYSCEWTNAKEPCVAVTEENEEVVVTWINSVTNWVHWARNVQVGKPGKFWYPQEEEVPLTEGEPVPGFRHAGRTYSHPSVSLCDYDDVMNECRDALFAARVHWTTPPDNYNYDYVAATHVVFNGSDGSVQGGPRPEHYLNRLPCDATANPSIACWEFLPNQDVRDRRAVCVWDHDDSYDGTIAAMAGFSAHEQVSSLQTIVPVAQPDGTGPRLRPAADGSLLYCSREGGNIHAGPVTSDGDMLPFLVGAGTLSSIAVDGDGKTWTAYTLDNSVLCDVAWGDTCVTVFTGDSTVIPGQPSIALYPTELTGGGWVANITFPVYDTTDEESFILYAKLNGTNLVLDTIAHAEALSDSCPCINVAGDSIYVTWQDDGLPVSSLLEYGVNDWGTPGSWVSLDSVPGVGTQPMSAISGDFLHLVWREQWAGSDTQVIRSAVRYVGSDTLMYSGWQAGPDRSLIDTAQKVNPVYAGEDVVVWQERASDSDPWDLRAQVWGDTLTLVALDTSAYHPHAVAVQTSPSPSVDRMTVNLLWTEGIVFEVDSGVYDTGATRFTVHTKDRSKACQYATATGNGAKLVRKPDSDSLFSVYRDADWCIMHAFSADGTEWTREPLFRADANCDEGLSNTNVSAALESPALAYDSTGRRWLVFVKPPVASHSDTSSLLLGTWRTGDTWATPQVVYEIDVDSGSVTGPSLAGASDGSVPCAYAAFLVERTAGTDVVVAKFDGDDLVTSTVQTGIRRTDPPCIASEPQENGDDLHLCWTDAGDVEYTMTAAAVPADSWSPTPFSWETPVNLTSTVAASWAPVTGVSGNRVVVAWAEQGDSSESYLSDVWSSCRSLDSAYDNWEDALNLSQSENAGSDNPVVGTERDSVVVAWQEWSTVANGAEQIMASAEFSDPVTLVTRAGASYPHVVLDNAAAGRACVHVIWSEEPGENYYEVGYEKCALGGSGGGGQSAGNVIQPLLSACRPNPFSQRTQINYQFPKTGRVHLRVYDASGRVVKTLQNGMQERGSYTVSWDGRDDGGRTVANGVYFYRVDAPGLRDTKKAVVTK